MAVEDFNNERQLHPRVSGAKSTSEDFEHSHEAQKTDMTSDTGGLNELNTESRKGHNISYDASHLDDTQQDSKTQPSEQLQFRTLDEVVMRSSCPKHTLESLMCSEQNLDVPIKLTVTLHGMAKQQDRYTLIVASNSIKTFDHLAKTLRHDFGAYIASMVDTYSTIVITHVDIAARDKVGSIVPATAGIIDNTTSYDFFIGLLRYKHSPLTGYCVCDHGHSATQMPEVTVHLKLHIRVHTPNSSCPKQNPKELISNSGWTISVEELVPKPKADTQNSADHTVSDQPKVLLCFTELQSLYEARRSAMEELNRLQKECERRDEKMKNLIFKMQELFHANNIICSSREGSYDPATPTATDPPTTLPKPAEVTGPFQPHIIDLTASPVSTKSISSNRGVDTSSRWDYNNDQVQPTIEHGDCEDHNEHVSDEDRMQHKQRLNTRRKLNYKVASQK